MWDSLSPSFSLSLSPSLSSGRFCSSCLVSLISGIWRDRSCRSGENCPPPSPSPSLLLGTSEEPKGSSHIVSIHQHTLMGFHCPGADGWGRADACERGYSRRPVPARHKSHRGWVNDDGVNLKPLLRLLFLLLYIISPDLLE